MTENLQNIVHIDRSEFPCGNGFDPCLNKERTISYALFVAIPEPTQTPEIIFKECCYNHIVLASSTDASLYKNDYSGFYHQRQVSNESCEFVMINMLNNDEIDLNDNSLGVLSNFGVLENLNLKTYILDWRKVLAAHGQGSYKVLKRVSISGIEYEQEYFVYNLHEYSTSLSDKTIRFDCTMTGLFDRTQIDFSGSDFKTSLRMPGFFGRREPKLEEDVLIDRNFVKQQISIKQVNEYKMQTNLIPGCVFDEFMDFMLLSDDLRVNDYNLNNTSYKYIDKKISVENNDGTGYGSHTRKTKINLTFTDKIVNNNKKNY